MSPKDMSSPHDALVKSTFSQPEHAAAWIRFVLPSALAARIDFATLTLLPGSFVDDTLRDRHTDLLYAVTTTGGALLKIYLLFEHQSTVDPLMPYRLLRYMVKIWDAHLAAHGEAKRLPPIVPLVLHHSEKGWTAGTAFEDVLAVDEETLAALLAHVPRFRFILDDISDEPDEALRARAMTALGRLMLFCLRHAREPAVLVDELGRWLDLRREILQARNGMAAMGAIWRYILHVSARGGSTKEDLVQKLLLIVGPEGKAEMVSIADEFIEEGRKEGARQILLKLLSARFGALPRAVVDRIQAADVARLDAWAERLLTATTLDEALGNPPGTSS
jgi:predicted transposase YdaD